MRKLKTWEINKRLYNMKRNANLVCLGALLDMEIFNKMQIIKEKKGIASNLEYIRKCYEIVKNNEL